MSQFSRNGLNATCVLTRSAGVFPVLAISTVISGTEPSLTLKPASAGPEPRLFGRFWGKIGDSGVEGLPALSFAGFGSAALICLKRPGKSAVLLSSSAAFMESMISPALLVSLVVCLPASSDSYMNTPTLITVAISNDRREKSHSAAYSGLFGSGLNSLPPSC